MSATAAPMPLPADSPFLAQDPSSEDDIDPTAAALTSYQRSMHEHTKRLMSLSLPQQSSSASSSSSSNSNSGSGSPSATGQDDHAVNAMARLANEESTSSTDSAA